MDIVGIIWTAFWVVVLGLVLCHQKRNNLFPFSCKKTRNNNNNNSHKTDIIHRIAERNKGTGNDIIARISSDKSNDKVNDATCQSNNADSDKHHELLQHDRATKIQ